MNQIILGQKIKEARLAKKMTQSEVVGSFITRNMLSQIESGTALPSMRTLAYLAQVLDLSLPELLATDTADDTGAPTELLTLRRLWAEQKLQKLFEFTDNPAADDLLFDEKSAYHARAAYALAQSAEQENQFATALSFAKEAEKWADIGFYANPSLKADALLLLSRIAGELGKRYSF